MVRIDFILEEKTDHFYFIEINTTPGQSENRLLSQQVRAEGMDIGMFYRLIVEETLCESALGLPKLTTHLATERLIISLENLMDGFRLCCWRVNVSMCCLSQW